MFVFLMSALLHRVSVMPLFPNKQVTSHEVKAIRCKLQKDLVFVYKVFL